jgi:hypothetical protein
MSSHREAPSISQDPVADNADTYAFVSPDDPSTVTIIANYVPLEGPPGGPNFFEFGDDVLYSIYIDNDGDALPEITYQFQFNTKLRNEDTFLYNTGQIDSLDSPNWNKRQFYSVSVIKGHGPGMNGKKQHHEQDGKGKMLAKDLASPPCNIGPFSTPNYPPLAIAAVHNLPSGETVFAGQRADPFYVDLGSVFDLADLRPFQSLHVGGPLANMPGVDTLSNINVHTIAIKVPISMLTRDGSTPTNVMDGKAVLGIWAGASRRKVRVIDDHGNGTMGSGPWMQVSRLGNPLFNEVIVPLGDKDRWNAVDPIDDSGFEKYVNQPELAQKLPLLYPGVFSNLAAYNGKPRADLHAILLTGIPAGIVPGFQNLTGPNPADMLRLNVAVHPTADPNPIGLVAGDAAGFPNGRRLVDNIVAIELNAVAGLTIPLVDSSFTPDAAAGVLTDGTSPTERVFLDTFPYVGVPHDGYDYRPGS